MTNRLLIYSIFLLIIIKIAAIYYTNFSLYGDEAQYWLWSQVPDLGYYSKPPLLAWFLFGYTGLFGDSFISLKTFPIVVYFFISFAIYRLCISLSLSKNSSFLCAISFLTIPAASLSSFLISTDLLLLFFWTVSMLVLLKTINDPTTKNFFLLGLFLGLALLAKYAAVYFLLNLLVLIIIDKKTFGAFKKNWIGSIVFLCSFFIILAPNIWWNLNNGWVTLSHTSDNANLQNLNPNLTGPLEFLGAQILMVGPFLVFFFVFFIKYFRLDFENKFLLVFSLPVFFIVLVESFLVRANANWAAPALISIFILLFRLVDNKKAILIKISFVSNYLIALILFFSILFSLNNNLFDRVKGLDEFTKEILLIVKDGDIVVSDRILFSNISYQIRNHPNKIFTPHQSGAVITNHFQMSSPLSSFQKNNFFLIGDLGDVSYLSKKYQGYLIKKFEVPFSSNKIKLYEIIFK